IDLSTTTVPVTDRVETSTEKSQFVMSDEELKRRVAALLDKNQLLCTMFGMCDGVRKEMPVTPKTIHNPAPAVNHLKFVPRIVTPP
ncbi:hypothetical protein PMAYCL1PPCAC_02767, partial [Pristionchus mayeri]